MKYLLVVFCCGFSSVLQAQVVTNVYWTEQTTLRPADIIYYSKARPLSWTDFRGTTNDKTLAAAVTASGFGYKADMSTTGNKSMLNVGIYCYFTKDKSWVKPGKTTDYILNHEQNHFNISFIAAKMFEEKLKKANLNRSNFNVLLPSLYQESCDIMNKMQGEYDSQTKNGQLRDVQQKWDAYLAQKVSGL